MYQDLNTSSFIKCMTPYRKHWKNMKSAFFGGAVLLTRRIGINNPKAMNPAISFFIYIYIYIYIYIICALSKCLCCYIESGNTFKISKARLEAKHVEPPHIHPEDGKCCVCHNAGQFFHIRRGSEPKAEVTHRPTNSGSKKLLLRERINGRCSYRRDE
jgi:hypothetical protein